MGIKTLDIEYGDFMYFIADIFTGPIQYGKRTEMCEWITSESFKKDKLINLGIYAKTQGLLTDGYESKNLAKPKIDVMSSMRQWTYQYCTEFGFFQIPNDKHPSRSQAIAPEYWLNLCKKVFSEDMKPPTVAEHNKKYGGLDIKGDNIFFFTAADDPWQYAGMTKIHDPIKQAGMKAFYVDCPDCGHCIDLHTPLETDPEILQKGREEAYETITEWLKKDKLEKELAEQSLTKDFIM